MALTALDFPASPTNGQLYPDPPVTGQPQYSWNGTQWLSSKAAVSQIARTDALGWSGMQINGSMEVSQEGATSALVTAAPLKYIVDGWAAGYSHSTAVMISQRVATGTTPIGSGAYFPYILSMGATTAFSGPSAGEYALLCQKIEGYRCARLGWGTTAAKSLTIAFWMFTPIAGTASVYIRNIPATRSYAAPITMSAATWEYKTVTIPGDTAGTWAKDHTGGMEIGFTFAAGSSFVQTSSAWVNGTGISVAGATNFFAAGGGAACYITGVVVLPGIEAPTAAQSPLIMRPFDQELATCQRYFYKRSYPTLNTWITTLQAFSTTQATGPLMEFPVTMRASPTVGSPGAFVGLLTAAGSPVVLTSGTIVTTPDFAYINSATIGSASLIAGNATVLVSTNTTNYYQFDARL